MEIGDTLRRQRLKREFQEAFDALRAKHGFPGATAAYSFRDHTQDFAAGFIDLEGRTPMPKNARFLSASVGKMHVGALGYSLHRQGKLDLDAKVSALLGDKAWFPRLPNSSAITLRHLLSHSAGLVDHVALPSFLEAAIPKMADPDFYYRPEELIAFILDREPLFPVGEGFAYTDTGFIVAGLALEKAGGASYYKLLRNTLLKPMRLTDTTPADRRRIDRLVSGYLPEANPLGLARSTMVDGKLIRHPLTEWTGGGLADTAQSLVKWSQGLFASDFVAESYTDAVLNYAVNTGAGEEKYGLGVAVRRTKLGARFCHGGWMPGYRADLSYYPDFGLSVSMLVNTDEEALMSNNAIHERSAELAELVVEHCLK